MESVLVFNESIYDDVILSPIYSFLRMSDECAALSQFPDNLLQYIAPVDTLKDFATLSLRNGKSLPHHIRKKAGNRVVSLSRIGWLNFSDQF